MKRYLLIFLIFVIPLSTKSQEGIHFLDVEFILNNSNYGKKIISKLKTLNSKNLSEIQSYEKQLKKEDSELQNIKNIISKEELNLKAEDLKRKIILFKEKKDKITIEYNDIKNRELEIFFKKITPYVEEFMEINSINIIIDKKNIFIANANYDITLQLVEYLNINLKDE